MKHHFVFRSVFALLLILQYSFAYAQELFKVQTNVLTDSQLTSLLSMPSKASPVKTLFSKASDGKILPLSIKMQSTTDTQFLLVNTATGNNVVFTPSADSANSEFRVAPFLIEELKQSTLGSAKSYLLLETDTALNIHSARTIEAPAEPVYLPQFYYRDNSSGLQEATPDQRRLVRIIKQCPDVTLANPDAPDAAETMARLADEKSVYSYAFELPNNDVYYYNVESNLEKNSKKLTIGSSLQFELYGTLTSEQQVAWEYALNRWGGVLKSAVPVRINVAYESAPNASWLMMATTTIVEDSQLQLAFPLSLRHCLAGKRQFSEADMTLTMNTAYQWYWGTNKQPSYAQIDGPTVFLHEVFHGLGFTGGISQWTGGWWYNYPIVYNTLLVSGSTGSSFLTGMTNTARLAACTGNNLYVDGTNLKAANGGNRIKIYAPSSFQSGSSVCHWDTSVSFPTFMKYAIGYGPSYVCHDINPRSIGMLKDMGWTLPEVYTVSFNANGGNGTMSSQTFTAGVSQALSSNIFTRSGYTFNGWNTNSAGTGTSYSNGQNISVTSNMTLYAQWKQDNPALFAFLTSPTDGSEYDFNTISSLTFSWNWMKTNALPFAVYFGTSSTGEKALIRTIPISDSSKEFLILNSSVLQVIKKYCGVSGPEKIYWWLGVEGDTGTYTIISDIRSFHDVVGLDLNCIGGDFSAGTVTPLAPGGQLDFKWNVNTNHTFGSSQQFWCEVMASKTGGFDMIRLGGTMTQSHVQKGLPGLSNILSPGTQLLNTVPDGRYTLVPCVNLPAHGISTSENNYADNWAPIAGKRLSVRNTAQPQVDLVLQDTMVVPNGPKNVTVSARVRNAGSGAMKGSGCWLEVFYGYLNAEGDIVPEGTIGPGQLVSGLDAGATMNCTLTGTVPAGVAAKALYVLADSTDIVPEQNKVNNSYLWYSPTVLPTGKNNGVDLEMTDLTVSGDQLAPTYQVKPGDKLNYSVTIRNKGVTLSTPVWLELFASQDGCGSRVRGASLTESEYLTMPEAGQSQTYQLSRTINSIGDGMYSVMAIVNRDGLAGNPGDMTPLNNRCKFSGGRISLATPTESGEVNLTWQGAPVFTYARGTGYMTVSGTVINTGTVTGSAFWVEPFIGHIESETGMFVRERPLTGGTCCAGLAPGETQEISLGGYAGPGKVIGILIDSTDLVAETDETDNYDYSELTQ